MHLRSTEPSRRVGGESICSARRPAHSPAGRPGAAGPSKPHGVEAFVLLVLFSFWNGQKNAPRAPYAQQESTGQRAGAVRADPGGAARGCRVRSWHFPRCSPSGGGPTGSRLGHSAGLLPGTPRPARSLGVHAPKGCAYFQDVKRTSPGSSVCTVPVQVRRHAHSHVHAHTDAHTGVHTCTLAHMDVHICTHEHMCTCVHAWTHTQPSWAWRADPVGFPARHALACGICGLTLERGAGSDAPMRRPRRERQGAAPEQASGSAHRLSERGVEARRACDVVA